MSVIELDIPFENIAFTPPTNHPGSNIRAVTFITHASSQCGGKDAAIAAAFHALATEIRGEINRSKFSKIHIVSHAHGAEQIQDDVTGNYKYHASITLIAWVW